MLAKNFCISGSSPMYVITHWNTTLDYVAHGTAKLTEISKPHSQLWLYYISLLFTFVFGFETLILKPIPFKIKTLIRAPN